jgi:peptidyl-tRNA hydrolase, PTH1 family
MDKIIVGLGNPGTQYKYSRHNVGFIILDEICKDLDLHWKSSAKFDGRYCVQGNTAFLKPQTFMNSSGTSVQKFAAYHGVPPDKIVVIHDDLDLEFLQTKKQIGAGAAGHHGVEDISEKLGTKDFWRIRIGVGRPASTVADTTDWVLSNFSPTELDQVQKKAEEIKKLIF